MVCVGIQFFSEIIRNRCRICRFLLSVSELPDYFAGVMVVSPQQLYCDDYMLTLHQGSVLVMAAANFSVISLSLVVIDAVYSSSVSSLSQIWVRRSTNLSTVSPY